MKPLLFKYNDSLKKDWNEYVWSPIEFIDPKDVLEGAKESVVAVVLVGYEKDGSLYVAGSTNVASHLLMMLKQGQTFIEENQV